MRSDLHLSTGLHWVSVDAVVSCLWMSLLSITVSSLVWVAPAGSLATVETGGDSGFFLAYSSVSPADSNRWFS